MSLVKTLARVAAGVMIAKGVGAVIRNSQNNAQNTGTGRSNPRQTGGGILGDLLQKSGSASPSGRQAGGLGGGLGDLLGGILGGQTGRQTGSSGGAGTGTRYGGPRSAGASGGLGGLFDQITGQVTGRTTGGAQTGATPAGSRSSQAGTGGGLGDLLGGLGSAAAAGGLGGLLGGLLGGRAAQAEGHDGLAHKDSQPRNDASFGEVFNDSLSSGTEPAVAPTPEQNAVAGLLLKAMIQAAKSDGKIDDAEKQRLLAEMGDLDDAERTFIRDQMAAPVDPQSLARETPAGLAPQVYLMSLMAIDFDNEAEARYLHALAQALELDQTQINQIHQEVGVQNLYS